MAEHESTRRPPPAARTQSERMCPDCLTEKCSPPVHYAVPLPSDELLRGRKAIAISHNGSIYRLQATRQGKLILTK